MSHIALIGMQFHSFHGYYTEEHSVGNNYEVDVIVDIKLSQDLLQDDLDKTINYEDIYWICQRQMSKPRRLIETVGNSILKELKSNLNTSATYTVCIRKMNPLLGGLVNHALYEVSG